MKPLSPKQVKAAWIIAAILVLIHFAPSILGSIRQPFSHANAAPAQPAPYRAAPAPSVMPTAPPASVALLPDARSAKFLGIWTGSGLMSNQDTCQVRLELRMSEDTPGSITGYETRACMPTLVLMGRKYDRNTIPSIVEHASPVSAVLTGTLINGDIAFRVDKTVGTLPDHCPLSSYAVSPFGQGQVIAQWQEGSCTTGQMLLTKTKG
jgi:hypothetical protein